MIQLPNQQISAQTLLSKDQPKHSERSATRLRRKADEERRMRLMSNLKSLVGADDRTLRERLTDIFDRNRRAREAAAMAEAAALMRRFGEVALAREWCANRLRGASGRRQRYLRLVWKHLQEA